MPIKTILFLGFLAISVVLVVLCCVVGYFSKKKIKKQKQLERESYPLFFGIFAIWKKQRELRSNNLSMQRQVRTQIDDCIKELPYFTFQEALYKAKELEIKELQWRYEELIKENIVIEKKLQFLAYKLNRMDKPKSYSYEQLP